MARNNKKLKIRLPELDPVYGNRQLTKLVNQVMKDGKKSIAQTQVYSGIENCLPNQPKRPLFRFLKRPSPKSLQKWKLGAAASCGAVSGSDCGQRAARIFIGNSLARRRIPQTAK